VNAEMVYNILNYGAKGDGITDDASAIQKAIDECAKNGGGQVYLPSGKVYLSTSIELKTSVDFHIASGAVLKVLPEKEKLVQDFLTAYPHTETPLAFIWAFNQDHVTISGDGIIEGSGGAFIEDRREYLDGSRGQRPTLIVFENCHHCTCKDFTVKDSPFWTLHPIGCNDVYIRGIRILNSLRLANSDGIDLDHSKNVRISDCHIESADDCICFKNTDGSQHYGACENITVTNCTLISTSSAIKIGTGAHGDFRNITISHCAISASNRGISIQIRDSGNVENMIVTDCTVETRRFHADWWGQGEPIYITSVDRSKGKTSGAIRNLQIRNIICTAENSVFIYADKKEKIQDAILENITLNFKKMSKWPMNLYDLRPSCVYGYNKLYQTDKTPAIFVHGTENLKLKNFTINVDESVKEWFDVPVICYESIGLKIDGIEFK